MELIQERMASQPVHELAIMHANALEDAEWMRASLEAALKPKYVHTCILTPVVGTHGGPGTIGVAASSR